METGKRKEKFKIKETVHLSNMVLKVDDRIYKWNSSDPPSLSSVLIDSQGYPWAFLIRYELGIHVFVFYNYLL